MALTAQVLRSMCDELVKNASSGSTFVTIAQRRKLISSMGDKLIKDMSTPLIHETNYMPVLGAEEARAIEKAIEKVRPAHGGGKANGLRVLGATAGIGALGLTAAWGHNRYKHAHKQRNKG